LDHIKQFVIQCPPDGKFDFLAKVFDDVAGATSYCIIFVKTREIAQKLLHLLNDANYNAVDISESMDLRERIEIMTRFKEGYVKIIITTNKLARGIDVPEVKFVINFDVPTLNGSDEADPESYLFRIGRAGRFGTPGIALTLLDRKVDKINFDEIIEHFDMTNKVTELRDVEHLNEVYKSMDSGDEFNEV
jgi:ATP-dependent RNA helicase UAP56/SUB2